MRQTLIQPALFAALFLSGLGAVPQVFAQVSTEVIVPPPPASTNAAPATTEPACAPKLPKEIRLGSYNRANLAAMVEDVEDLCSGRSLAPADAATVQRRNDASSSSATAPSRPNQNPVGMR